MAANQRIARRAALALGAASLLIGAGQAGDQIEGRWIKDGPFSQMHTACSQAWICVPKQSTMYSAEFKLAGQERQATWGTCAAGGGAVDGCNVCLVSPPEEACALTLEPR